MSFDLETARVVCDKIKRKNWNIDDGIDIRYLNIQCAEILPAALDEVERLQKALALKIEQHKGQAYVIGSYLGMLTDFNELNESQAKHIAELDAAHLKAQNSNLLRKQAYESLEKIANKQRSALKKLGTAKRERGKALVEERAKSPSLALICPHADDELFCDTLETYCHHWEDCPHQDERRKSAQEQLRQEGKI